MAMDRDSVSPNNHVLYRVFLKRLEQIFEVSVHAELLLRIDVTVEVRGIHVITKHDINLKQILSTTRYEAQLIAIKR